MNYLPETLSADGPISPGRPRGRPHKRLERLQAGSPPLRAARERRAQRDHGHHQCEYQGGEANRGRQHYRSGRPAQQQGRQHRPAHHRGRGRPTRQFRTVSSRPGRGRARSRGACLSEPYPAGPVHGCFAGFHVRRVAVVPRSADSAADRELTARLAARGLAGSCTRYQRWRRAGLLPRHERRGAGRGTARPPCSPPRLWEIAAALARHAGQGRDLRFFASFEAEPDLAERAEEIISAELGR